MSDSKYIKLSVQGFTLLEMLAALTLLGVILAMVYSGLRTGAKATDKGERFVEQINQVRHTQEFIRYQLKRMLPLAIDVSEETQQNIIFEGEEGKIRFVAPMPGYLGKGGPHVQTIELVKQGSDMELVFSHQLLNIDEEDIDEDEIEPILLLSNVQDGKFTYLARPDINSEEPEWIDEWEKQEELPMMIQLELELNENMRVSWPLLTVAPVIDASSANRNIRSLMRDRDLLLP